MDEKYTSSVFKEWIKNQQRIIKSLKIIKIVLS